MRLTLVMGCVKSFILIIIGFLLVRLLVIYYWKIIEWKKLALKELNEYALNKCTFIFAQILKIQIRSNKLFPLYSYEQSRMWTAFSARLKTHTHTHVRTLTLYTISFSLARTHTTFYRVFHGFGQFADGGSILGLSQLSLLS